jgi:5,10-methylene-tetrahydrofolate dehydrogenase/methenyl tetrahydrofolate cyclohydrolase
MGARVIDGRGLAAELNEELAAEVAGLRDAGVVPGLATVLVGSPAEVAVYRALDPLKDIEVAVHPVNAGLLAFGRPRCLLSTPAAAFHMFDRCLVGSDRDPAEFYSRSNVVFVGRSNNVGKPAVSLRFSRNATVISCDERAYNAGRLAEFTTRADILIVAAGVPGLIKKEHVREGVIASRHRNKPGGGPPDQQTGFRGRLGLLRGRDQGRGTLAGPGRRRPDHRRVAPQKHRQGRPDLHSRRGSPALAGDGRQG